MSEFWNRTIFVFSNQNILILTTVLFGIFVISEIIGGIIANSLSLLGDATAMSVDVLTYCGNIYAESLKRGSNGGQDIDTKTTLITEVIVPIISLVSLVGVSCWVSYDASLRLRGHKEEDVELLFMYIFPIANFIIDIFCAFLFYLRRENIFHHEHIQLQQITSDCDFSADFSDSSSDSSGNEIELSDFHNHQHHPRLSEGANLMSSKSTSKQSKIQNNQTHLDKSGNQLTQNQNQNQEQEQEQDLQQGQHHTERKGTNINMVSAFTHVTGDTLRTIATFAAAGISSYLHIDPSICDAWAAIIVSITITFSVIPLVYSIVRTICSLTNGSSSPCDRRNVIENNQ